MSEQQTEQGPQPGRAALPLNEAAALEGVAPDALRMRYRRGKVDGYRDSAGHVFIYSDQLTERGEQADRTKTEPPPNTSELVDELRRQLARLEAREGELLDDLRREREASSRERYRADTLLQAAQTAQAQAAQQAAQALALLPAPGQPSTPNTHQATTGAQLVNLDQAGPTMNTAEAAAALGRSPRTLRAWAKQPDAPIRPLDLPGPHRWSTAEVLRLVRGG